MAVVAYETLAAVVAHEDACPIESYSVPKRHTASHNAIQRPSTPYSAPKHITAIYSTKSNA